MKVRKHGFYLIKDSFFKNLQDPCFPSNKNGRPMYYCVQDKNNLEILWVVPMTTKIEKVNRMIREAGGEEKCKIYVLNSNEPKSAFNVQDIFPIIEKYIEREYLKRGIPYILKDKNLIEKIEKKVFNMINAKMVAKNRKEKEIDVQKIYQTLEKELGKERTPKIPKKKRTKEENER